MPRPASFRAGRRYRQIKIDRAQRLRARGLEAHEVQRQDLRDSLQGGVARIPLQQKTCTGTRVLTPTRPETWTDLLQNARKLTKATGTSRSTAWASAGGEVGNMITLLMGFIWMNGGDVVSSDYKRITINEPAGGEAVKFYTDLLTTYKVAPPSTLQNDGTACGTSSSREASPSSSRVLCHRLLHKETGCSIVGPETPR